MFCPCQRLLMRLKIELLSKVDVRKLQDYIDQGSPVILPASSGCRRCTRGNRRSPSICFCCSGGAAASMAVVRPPEPSCNSPHGEVCQPQLSLQSVLQSRVS